MLSLDRLWNVFGSADLGGVTFENLVRRPSPNDALACPREFCKATPDVTSPEFSIGADGLRSAMAKVLASEPRIEKVHSDDASLTDRYIQRTALMGFPDTIVVRFLPLAGDRSTLAIYSRSKFGYSDLGANKARIQRWLAKLKQQAPVSG